MFIKKGDGYVKSAQGNTKTTDQSKAGTSLQTIGKKGSEVNWNSKWQGTTLKSPARG